MMSFSLHGFSRCWKGFVFVERIKASFFPCLMWTALAPCCFNQSSKKTCEIPVFMLRLASPRAICIWQSCDWDGCRGRQSRGRAVLSRVKMAYLYLWCTDSQTGGSKECLEIFTHYEIRWLWGSSQAQDRKTFHPWAEILQVSKTALFCGMNPSMEDPSLVAH